MIFSLNCSLMFIGFLSEDISDLKFIQQICCVPLVTPLTDSLGVEEPHLYLSKTSGQLFIRFITNTNNTPKMEVLIAKS